MDPLWQQACEKADQSDATESKVREHQETLALDGPIRDLEQGVYVVTAGSDGCVIEVTWERLQRKY
jgi:hypothetical protein